mmetsp:Transcript_22417/g.29065  ORF Transcript_22417/g.29065 Transcript_22417/m.29065 type:complete len:1559 (-) Transcript_22417:350-5026(-)
MIESSDTTGSDIEDIKEHDKSFEDILKEQCYSSSSQDSEDSPVGDPFVLGEALLQLPELQGKSNEDIIQHLFKVNQQLQTKNAELERELRTAAEIGQDLLNVKEELEHELETERQDAWKARQETQGLWARVEDLGAKLFELQCVNLELSAEQHQVEAQTQNPFISNVSPAAVPPESAAADIKALKKMVEKLKAENVQLHDRLEEEKLERELAQKVQQKAQQVLSLPPSSSPSHRDSTPRRHSFVPFSHSTPLNSLNRTASLGSKRAFNFEHHLGDITRSKSLPCEHCGSPTFQFEATPPRNPSYSNLVISESPESPEKEGHDTVEEKEEEDARRSSIESEEALLNEQKKLEVLKDWNLVLQQQLEDQTKIISALRSQVRVYRRQVEPALLHQHHSLPVLKPKSSRKEAKESTANSDSRDRRYSLSSIGAQCSVSSAFEEQETDDDGEHLDIGRGAALDGRTPNTSSFMKPPPASASSQKKVRALDSFYTMNPRTPFDNRARSAPPRTGSDPEVVIEVETETPDNKRSRASISMRAKLDEATKEYANIVEGIQQTEAFGFLEDSDADEETIFSVLEESGFGSETGGFGKKSLAAELAAVSELERKDIEEEVEKESSETDASSKSESSCPRCRGLRKLDSQGEFISVKEVWKSREEAGKLEKSLQESEAVVSELRVQLENARHQQKAAEAAHEELVEKQEKNKDLEGQLQVAEDNMLEMQAENEKQKEELEAQILELKISAAETEKQIQSLQSEKTASASRLSLLEMEKDGLQQKFHSLQRELEEDQKRSEVSKKALEDQLKEKEERLHSLQLEVAQLKSEYENLDEQNGKLKSNLEEAEMKASNLQIDLAGLQESYQVKVGGLESELSSLQDSHVELMDHMEELQEELQASHEQEAELDEAIDDLKEQHKKEMDEKQQENEKIQEHLEDEVHQLEEENTQLQGEIDGLQEKLANYFEELQAAQEAEAEKIEHMKLKLETQEAELKEAQKQRLNADEKSKQKQDQAEEFQEKYKDLLAHHQHTEKEMEKLTSQLEPLKQSAKELQTTKIELQEVHSELARLKAVNETSSQALIDAGKSIQRVASETDVLQGKYEILEAERKALLKKLEQYEQVSEDLDSSQTRLASMETKEKNLSATLEASEVKIQILENKLAAEVERSAQHAACLEEKEQALSAALDSLKKLQAEADAKLLEAERRWASEDLNKSEQHQKTLEEQQLELTNMEARLKQAEESLREFQHEGSLELEDLEAEKARLLESLRHANVEAEDFRKIQSEMKEELERLYIRNDELEKEKAAILELAEHSSSAEAIQSGVVKDLKAKIAKAREDRKELLQQTKSKETELKKVETELQATYSRAAQAEKERDQLASKVEYFQLEKVKLETRVRRFEAESERFQDHKNEHVRLECKLTGATVELEATKKLLDEQRRKNHQLHQDIDALERDQRELRSGVVVDNSKRPNFSPLIGRKFLRKSNQTDGDLEVLETLDEEAKPNQTDEPARVVTPEEQRPRSHSDRLGEAQEAEATRSQSARDLTSQRRLSASRQIRSAGRSRRFLHLPAR